jgi:carbon storage regulator
MYVLARHEGESIIIADVIEIKVLSVTGRIARLGINAPREVPVKRAELLIDLGEGEDNNDNKD